LHTSEL
jgi:hypothetical protein